MTADELRGAWRRLAVLGDSLAAGVREPHPGYRDLSWVDRIAEALEAETLKLAKPHLVAREVREGQLAAALEWKPDLAVVTAGGNDALRPSFDPAITERELEAIVAPLRAAGGGVVLLELLDYVKTGLVPAEHAPALDARLGALAALTRRVAERQGTILVAMRSHPSSADRGIFASDRLHLNARGHAIVAAEALKALQAARTAPPATSTHHASSIVRPAVA